LKNNKIPFFCYVKTERRGMGWSGLERIGAERNVVERNGVVFIIKSDK